MGAFRDAILVAKNGDSKAVELLYDQFSPLLLKCSMQVGNFWIFVTIVKAN